MPTNEEPSLPLIYLAAIDREYSEDIILKLLFGDV